MAVASRGSSGDFVPAPLAPAGRGGGGREGGGFAYPNGASRRANSG